MVFVMAGWLVPAMAMEDEGPEPPKMKTTQNKNGALTVGVKENNPMKTQRSISTNSLPVPFTDFNQRNCDQRHYPICE